MDTVRVCHKILLIFLKIETAPAQSKAFGIRIQLALQIQHELPSLSWSLWRHIAPLTIQLVLLGGQTSFDVGEWFTIICWGKASHREIGTFVLQALSHGGLSARIGCGFLAQSLCHKGRTLRFCCWMLLKGIVRLVQMQVVWSVAVDCVFDWMTHAECINIVLHIRVMFKIDSKLFITLNIQALIDSYSHPVGFQSISLYRVRILICLRSLFSIGIFCINRDPTVMFAQQAVRIFNYFHILVVVFTHLLSRRCHHSCLIAIGLTVIVLSLPRRFGCRLWYIDKELIWHWKFSFVTV